MKRFVIAVVLTCALATTVLAGNIPTDGAAAPTPPPATQSSSVAATVVLTIISLIRR